MVVTRSTASVSTNGVVQSSIGEPERSLYAIAVEQFQYAADLLNLDEGWRAILSHWSVMVQGTSQVFAAGPPVVERSLGQKTSKEDLGGAGLAVDLAGTIDNRAATEAECFALIRRFLSYLPQNVWELPPAVASTDPVERFKQTHQDYIDSKNPNAQAPPPNIGLTVFGRFGGPI